MFAASTELSKQDTLLHVHARRCAFYVTLKKTESINKKLPAG